MFPSSTSPSYSALQNKPRGEMASASEKQEQDEAPSTQFQSELQDFREKWHKELQISSNKPKEIDESSASVVNEDQSNHEKVARILFMKGVDMEKTGKFYEAIQFYRKAIQMVPDIELKLHDSSKTLIEKRFNEDLKEYHDQVGETSSESDDELVKYDLLSRIQKKMGKIPAICTPKIDQANAHLSSLPLEIILYILRWVVSSELDLRSLEMFGQTCRGFYLCARDSEIWRLACLKVWGMHCGKSAVYGSWRQMFIERARLRFNGCYISKTTYIRHGENNFQDQFYKPWHLVAYYRCLRFFPDGTVLMLTSPDEPSQCVSQLRHKYAKTPVLSGFYRLNDDRVALVIQQKRNQIPRKIRRDFNEIPEQTYHIEFQIMNHRKRKHIQLHWIYYSITTKTRRSDENVCIFDLVANKFPPLWFSRVKSYTNESENPLM